MRIRLLSPMYSGLFLAYFTRFSNRPIVTSSFQDELKLAGVMSTFKKNDPLGKERYRPISLLSHMLKIFEKIFFNQINENIQPYFLEKQPSIGVLTKRSTREKSHSKNHTLAWVFSRKFDAYFQNTFLLEQI